MPMSSLLMQVLATNEYVPSTFIGVTKMPSDTSYMYQVIQFVTKLYPQTLEVTIHLSKRSRKLTIPKKVTIEELPGIYVIFIPGTPNIHLYIVVSI